MDYKDIVVLRGSDEDKKEVKFLSFLLLLLGCHTPPERAMPEKIVDGIRYAFVADKFVIYATGEVSQEYYNCMMARRNLASDPVWTQRMIEWEEHRKERVRKGEIKE